ncbi:hypothetical protein GBA65_17990 [Rubrobacter marinus]|uniref:Acetamidase n=1 Tax=Rubrobacter marinus TaxID=2653852 RepID=A0A6G8Q0Y3_9ACTN|nr:acetamidase/formamidase family protein [Rubrobacter marinus]QIN80098.1 hypothetical protein GBA65_17990 [Rubrobacter marinus]
MKREVEKKIEREAATVTEFGAHLEPALRVEQGEKFVVETQDNLFGQINSEDVLLTAEHLPALRYQFWKVNPVAGPIHVEGCEAGDLLVLEIEDIVPSERGWTGFAPTSATSPATPPSPSYRSPTPASPTTARALRHDLRRHRLLQREPRGHLPLRPFLGTIVTAPERGIENTLVSQGPWGGNIDCRDVKKGNKIYMNAYHDGGLLFFGDAHAAQGDSEYTGIADETAADTTARCHVVKRKRVPGVLRIETAESLIQVDSARNAGSMERALNGAFIGMMQWLTEEHGMDGKEAYLHFTANPDVRIHTYQFVGPAFYVVGVEFLKKYL